MALAFAPAAASGFRLAPSSLLLPHPLRTSPSSAILRAASSSSPRSRRCGCGAVVRCAKRTGKRRYPSEKKRLDRRHKDLLRQAAPEEGSEERESGYWRLFKLAVPARDDPGKDFTGISLPLLQAIAKAIKFPDFSESPRACSEVCGRWPPGGRFFDFVSLADEWSTTGSAQRREVGTSATVTTRVSGWARGLLQRRSRGVGVCRSSRARYEGATASGGGSLGDAAEGWMWCAWQLRWAASPLLWWWLVGVLRWSLLKREVGAAAPGSVSLATVASMLPDEAFTVVRKSFDARKILKEPQFTYTVDVDVKKLLDMEPRAWDFIARLEPKLGVVEYMPKKKLASDLISMLNVSNKGYNNEQGIKDTHNGSIYPQDKKPRVAVIGSGPSGLFASLVLGELGAEVTLLERGQPVEQRGRDIGALAVRRILQSESNFCFGEGGAGTWSDGKLVTRIGRNADGVQAVLKTFVHFGAPRNILVDGKPHLGTDKLVPLLRNIRNHLRESGVTIRFNARVDDLIVEDGQVKGIVVSDSELQPGSGSQKLTFDAVVLAVGHSARDTYNMLQQHDVDMSPKSFAVGLRIEHPQELINSIQREFERRAAIMGGGNFVVPAQRVTDFIRNRLSVTTLPSSSYRLGVRPSKLHELFPPYITEALQQSIIMIDREMPGFISNEALLHGVEVLAMLGVS
nr:unnamed protein product [Digitaria exilis]